MTYTMVVPIIINGIEYLMVMLQSREDVQAKLILCCGFILVTTLRKENCQMK